MRRQPTVFSIACQFSVYPYIVGRFHTFEIEEYVQASPISRHGKLPDISSYRIIIGRYMRRIRRKRITGICIDRRIEALQLPTSRHLYPFPSSGGIIRLMEVAGSKPVVSGIKELPGTVERNTTFGSGVDIKPHFGRKRTLLQRIRFVDKRDEMRMHRFPVDFVHLRILPRHIFGRKRGGKKQKDGKECV